MRLDEFCPRPHLQGRSKYLFTRQPNATTVHTCSKGSRVHLRREREQHGE
jgi:hypothetical protein